jgi:hypothetical protein
VDEPRITQRKLDAALARVYAEPFYIPRNTAEFPRTPELLLLAEDTEPDDEDFAQPVSPSLL